MEKDNTLLMGMVESDLMIGQTDDGESGGRVRR